MEEEYYNRVDRIRYFLKQDLIAYVKVILIALIFTKVILPLFVLIAYIPSGSMIPTLNIKDEVITINKYWLNLERGDILVFQPTEEQVQQEGSDKYFIKRLIGLPGDRVQIKGNKVYVNSKLLDEKYIDRPFDYNGTFVVPKDRYFMLGDNRGISYDARYWKNPFIKYEQIVSVAKWRLLPFSNFGKID